MVFFGGAVEFRLIVTSAAGSMAVDAVDQNDDVGKAMMMMMMMMTTMTTMMAMIMIAMLEMLHCWWLLLFVVVACYSICNVSRWVVVVDLL